MEVEVNVFRMYLSMRALTALEERKKKGKNPEGTVLRDAPLVDCTSFSSAWYQIISKQRAPSIICRGGCRGDIFHETFMPSAPGWLSVFGC